MHPIFLLLGNLGVMAQFCPALCHLYTCLNHSVPINVSKDSGFLVWQRTDLWVPVKISEPWSDSTLLSFVLRESLKRSKCFIGWIIAAIVGII